MRGVTPKIGSRKYSGDSLLMSVIGNQDTENRNAPLVGNRADHLPLLMRRRISCEPDGAARRS